MRGFFFCGMQGQKQGDARHAVLSMLSEDSRVVPGIGHVI